jgi:hypothetical protein
MASVAKVPYILRPPKPVHHKGGRSSNNNLKFLCGQFLVHRNTGLVPSDICSAVNAVACRCPRTPKRSSSTIICSAANKPSPEIRCSLSLSYYYFFLNLNCGCYSTVDVVLKFMVCWHVHCSTVVMNMGHPNKALYMKDNLGGGGVTFIL